ncbi:YchJ family protein [uncultured Endozoicomonas sp.]|uniref:YchJ family protein n=1 Tax=uncultured Endozoicomonas sp. TaxID=432652 RepID=UPI002634A2F5|nr:YchJ family protein [uncultured Endozoicomonas sp.]
MKQTVTESLCPCGSQQTMAACCGQYLENLSAPTAEKLMRSRYTAYTLNDFPYLITTTHPEQQAALREQQVYEQTPDTLWQKLEILDTQAGQESDTSGTVEFKASFREDEDGPVHAHQECSSFSKINGRWYFIYPNQPFQKIGRNDPCPCSSGKKYKKCCQ